ncbi:MAG: FAD-dependent oxidoreductase, partial [Candidatus Hydrothermarchaeota archaeon]|nr:FAD-dependent oxidoreductase [Candidatus Hydrothermarchaeota archaeon]
MRKNCIVVGAGISGLVAAHELAKVGYKITVLEKNSFIGGRIYPFVREGFTADAGAQLIGEEYYNTFRLLKDIGLENDLIKLNEPSAALYSGKKIFSLNFLGIIKHNKLNFYDKLDLYRLLKKVDIIGKQCYLTFTNEKNQQDFDSISIAEWTIKNSTERILEYFVQPSITALTLTEPEKLSALYGLTLLYSDLKNSYTLKNGLSSVISSISQKLKNFGGIINTNCEVVKIERENKKFVVEYKHNNETKMIETSNVICSTPAFATIKILPKLSSSTKSALSNVEYSSGLQILLALNEPVWNNSWAILIPRKELKDFAMISESTVASPTFAPKGKGLMEVFVYGKTANRLSKLSKPKIIKFILDKLKLLFPKISKKLTWYEVIRWDYVIPIYPPGFSEIRREFKTSIDNLALAGDYLYLPSIESAVYSGFKAAQQIKNSM